MDATKLAKKLELREHINLVHQNRYSGYTNVHYVVFTYEYECIDFAAIVLDDNGNTLQIDGYECKYKSVGVDTYDTNLFTVSKYKNIESILPYFDNVFYFNVFEKSVTKGKCKWVYNTTVHPLPLNMSECTYTKMKQPKTTQFNDNELVWKYVYEIPNKPYEKIQSLDICKMKNNPKKIVWISTIQEMLSKYKN